jgi:hypothetical protein
MEGVIGMQSEALFFQALQNLPGDEPGGFIAGVM